MCSGIDREDDNCFSKKYIENFCTQWGEQWYREFLYRVEKSGNYVCERGDLRFDSANDVHSPIQIRLYNV